MSGCLYGASSLSKDDNTQNTLCFEIAYRRNAEMRTEVPKCVFGVKMRRILRQMCRLNRSVNGISSTIKVSGEKLETVQSFKYLGAIVTDEGSRPEILSRIAQATGALANLKVIWKDKKIALSTKIRLLRSLIMSIFLYACETWTLTAERKIQTMEMRSFRRLLGISYREHITN